MKTKKKMKEKGERKTYGTKRNEFNEDKKKIRRNDGYEKLRKGKKKER